MGPTLYCVNCTSVDEEEDKYSHKKGLNRQEFLELLVRAANLFCQRRDLGRSRCHLSSNNHLHPTTNATANPNGTTKLERLPPAALLQ